MIRSEVMGWATIFLVILFAFILIPTHERFVDAKGKYTDVSPDAPPMPAWLNPGGQNKNTLVGPGGVSPLIDSSTEYSRTAPKNKILGSPISSTMGSAPVGAESGSSCWADPVDADSGKFISHESYGKYMSKIMPAVTACYGGSFPAVPTPAQLECVKKATSTYTSLEEAKAACSADATCKAVLSQPQGGGPPVYSKYTEDVTIVPGGGPNPGMKIYVKKPCAAGTSHLDLLPSPTAAAPRITSTLGTADPSLSGMNSAYTSGVIPPSGSPWPGLKGLTEMASVNTNPKFEAQTHPNPPTGTLSPTTPDLGLYGPGPNVLRKNLVRCTCASQSAGCPLHR